MRERSTLRRKTAVKVFGASKLRRTQASECLTGSLYFLELTASISLPCAHAARALTKKKKLPSREKKTDIAKSTAAVKPFNGLSITKESKQRSALSWEENTKCGRTDCVEGGLFSPVFT